MKVLGLDISTRTGVTLAESGKIITHAEEIEFKMARGFKRASQIAAEIILRYERFDPDLIVIENYGFSNAHTLVTLVEIGAIIRYELFKRQIAWLDVAPTSLKKFLGKGNLPKELVRLETFKQFGYEHVSNNVVDAAVLSFMGLAILGDYPLSSSQYSAIVAIAGVKENHKWQPKRKRQRVLEDDASRVTNDSQFVISAS